MADSLHITSSNALPATVPSASRSTSASSADAHASFAGALQQAGVSQHSAKLSDPQAPLRTRVLPGGRQPDPAGSPDSSGQTLATGQPQASDASPSVTRAESETADPGDVSQAAQHPGAVDTTIPLPDGSPQPVSASAVSAASADLEGNSPGASIADQVKAPTGAAMHTIKKRGLAAAAQDQSGASAALPAGAALVPAASTADRTAGFTAAPATVAQHISSHTAGRAQPSALATGTPAVAPAADAMPTSSTPAPGVAPAVGDSAAPSTDVPESGKATGETEADLPQPASSPAFPVTLAAASGRMKNAVPAASTPPAPQTASATSPKAAPDNRASTPPETSSTPLAPTQTHAASGGAAPLAADVLQATAPVSGRGVAPTLTGGHIGVQHSSALAADAVAQPVAATRASALEVGFHDDTLGWLSVRASSDLAGDLHATVSARSQVSTPAVENMLPALERFLQDHSVAVHSVSGATAVGTVPVPAVGNTSSASTLHANTTGGGAGNQAGGTGGNSPRNSGGSNSPQQRQSAWQQQSGVASTLWTADLATAPSFAQVERTSVVSVRI